MPHDFSNTTLSGKFALIRRIGHGGMATVYEATNLQLGKRVAIKILNPEYITNPTMLARFEQEARGVARLDHPNIVEVHDFAIDGDRPYIVMAYLSGTVLSDAIREAPPMPWTRAIDLCVQVCAALAHAHDQGILHRDIKPNNIFLCESLAPDHVKLLDFGIAKVLEVAPGEPNPGTNPSQAPGTPEYMAPEQAMGAGCDARTDVYAVGVTLYRLLTGQTPFRGISPSETLALHIYGALRSPRVLRPDLPAAVEAVILKALARTPEDRWQSAAEFQQALTTLRGPALRLAATASSDMSLPLPAADADPWDTLDRQESFLRRRRAGTTFTGVALGLGTFMLLSLFQMPGVELFAPLTRSSANAADRPPTRPTTASPAATAQAPPRRGRDA
jgi:serine/threonine protein kinase